MIEPNEFRAPLSNNFVQGFPGHEFHHQQATGQSLIGREPSPLALQPAEAGTSNLRTGPSQHAGIPGGQPGQSGRSGFQTTPHNLSNSQPRGHLDTNVMKRRGMVSSKNKSSFPGMNKSVRAAVSQNQYRHGSLNKNYMSQKMTSSGIPKNLEIKYRKDMQQLKFYQTLNNYQNIQAQQQAARPANGSFNYSKASPPNLRAQKGLGLANPSYSAASGPIRHPNYN